MTQAQPVHQTEHILEQGRALVRASRPWRPWSGPGLLSESRFGSPLRRIDAA